MVREIGTRARPEVEALVGHSGLSRAAGQGAAEVAPRPEPARAARAVSGVVTRRVVGPTEVAWEVVRECVRARAWSRESPDPGDDILEDAGERLSDVGLFAEGEWWATALVFLGGLVVSLIFFVVLPAALRAPWCAGGARCARRAAAPISRWTVTARSLQARLEWRVRGTRRSARAVQELAAALERRRRMACGRRQAAERCGSAPVLDWAHGPRARADWRIRAPGRAASSARRLGRRRRPRGARGDAREALDQARVEGASPRSRRFG